MNSEEAKDLLDNLIGMVEDNQNNDYDEALKLAIRSLKAWEEVLQELEEMKCEYDCTPNEFQRGANAGANFIRNKAIDIINQHLAKIEE